MNDVIYFDTPPVILPREPASTPGYIKHVSCEGLRAHVISWDSRGRHCSEPDCIINAKELKDE